jgi:hypothetical protein
MLYFVEYCLEIGKKILENHVLLLDVRLGADGLRLSAIVHVLVLESLPYAPGRGLVFINMLFAFSDHFNGILGFLKPT